MLTNSSLQYSISNMTKNLRAKVQKFQENT